MQRSKIGKSAVAVKRRQHFMAAAYDGSHRIIEILN
jgi:hypothetical protein